jgi:L-ascorbate metabolism protein UlaG (beta-lactamase superfamily)
MMHKLLHIACGVVFVLSVISSCSMSKKVDSYVINPKLSVIKQGWKGNPMVGNKFTNDSVIERYSFWQLLKWKFSVNPQRKEKKADTFRVETIATTDFISSKNDMIVWLGHASFFIRINGVTILTDPCYGKMLFQKRLAKMPCKTEEIKGIDYILVSHNHRDHFDLGSLSDLYKVNPNAKALLPLKGGSVLKKVTSNYEEAGWYQQYSTNPKIKIFFMPAKHWGRRGVFDFNKVLWGSFVIQSDTTTIYFAGDTSFGDQFEEVSKLFPKIDYALIPVGAYKPPYIMKRAHISPTEAIEGAKILKPTHFIPMHYATYDLSDEPIGEPIRTLKDIQLKGQYTGIIDYLKIGQELLIK